LELIELIGIYDDHVEDSNRLLWYDISHYKAIPVWFILANADKKWNWYALGMKENITMEYVRFYRDNNIYNEVRDAWVNISKNKVIKWKDVVDNPDIPWSFVGLSTNPNITWDIVLENVDKEWSWQHLSYKEGLTWDRVGCASSVVGEKLVSPPSLTLDIIKTHMDKNWNYYGVCSQDSMTWEMFVKLKAEMKVYCRYFWAGISCNKNIDWDIIKANRDLPWNWDLMSGNPIITWDIVCDNVDISWCYKNLSMNANITWEIVTANPDKCWWWALLSRRGDMLLSGIEKVRIVRQHFACLVIQRAWRECIANPGYMLCRRRLLREAADLC
jgi:hypothetical protein